MSSRAGGGASNTSSSARNPLAEDDDRTEKGLDDNDDQELQECDTCAVCSKNVLEGQEGLLCETCNTWFHRKCMNLTLKQYKLHAMSPNPWYCSNCPTAQIDDFSLHWGGIDGLANIQQKVKEFYSQIVEWKANMFMPPLGKVGKGFIKELTRLLELFTNKTPWEPVALHMLHIFIPLMLQRPTFNSRYKENIQYLSARLHKWSEGRIDEILSECVTIQKRLGGALKNKEVAHHKAFTRLMLLGKVSKALKYIDGNSNISGVHDLNENENILESLKCKHPIAKPLNTSVVITPDSENIVEPVVFEDITGDIIHNIAKDISGSGGPTQVDSDVWRHLICNRSYSKVSSALSQSIADLTKRFCKDDIDSSYCTSLFSCRLIPLKKSPDPDGNCGIRPIGIGEVLRRIMAKAVSRILRRDIQNTTGTIQTCTGVDSGIESTIHAMAKAYSDDTTEALLLVDAENAFNNLNRKTALENVKSLCPSFYTFLNNSYKSPSNLYVSGSASHTIIESQEGTTQGDPCAMDMYAVAITPLIKHLSDKTDITEVKQGWYADDSSSVGTLSGILKWWECLASAGPSFGYYPNASKTWLILKDSSKMDVAKDIFESYGINITTDGNKHLGAVIGSENYKQQYVDSKVSGWVNDMEELTIIAKEEPQVALSAFTKGLCRRWTYVQRTIPGISGNFQPLEEVIAKKFIPALIGRDISQLERRYLALPTRYGGLGIQDPTATADIEFDSSSKITEPLANLIYNQDNRLSELNVSQVRSVKQALSLAKSKRFENELEMILSLVDPLTERSIQAAKEKNASSWLNALPLKHMGYVLNKQEFRDALCLRYNWKISDIPRYCGCGCRNDIVHVLTCKKGGYVAMRHNSLRDGIANIMKEVCTDVKIEPPLLPVNPGDFSASCNVAEEARLDISARGVQSTFERTFYDIRVTHPFAASNVLTPLDRLYVKHEKEKVSSYAERVINVEKGSFVPVVFTTTGGTGPMAKKLLQRLAEMIATKRGERYPDILNFIRTKLRFSLLRSVLIAIRGERGKSSAKEPYIYNVAFNLILNSTSYDC